MRWGEHDTVERNEKYIQNTYRKTLMDGTTLGLRMLHVDNINIYITGTGYESVDWVRVAQDSDQYQVLINMMVNLGVPYKACHFLAS
jgi:hypothetical protein